MQHESLNRSPKKNWVERAGQLPAYIQHIAKDIHEERGLPLDQAIPIAISRVKVWATGKGVSKETQAKAAKALAEWEALKAKSHAKKAGSKVRASETAVEKIVRLSNRKFSTETREKLADKGAAMPDGSFPIPDKGALRRAILSFGRGKGDKAAIKAHIKKRARALGATDMLPEGW